MYSNRQRQHCLPPMQPNSPTPTQQQSSSAPTTATPTLPQTSNTTVVVPMIPQWTTAKTLVFSSSDKSSDVNSDLTTTTMQTTVESITPKSPARRPPSVFLPPSHYPYQIYTISNIINYKYNLTKI